MDTTIAKSITISTRPETTEFLIEIDNLALDNLRFNKLLGFRFPVHKYTFLSRLVDILGTEIGKLILEANNR